VSAAFKAEGEEPRELSEADRLRAQYARDLLLQWRTLPGTNEAGVVAGDELRNWVLAARQEGAKKGRAKITDYLIGELLSGARFGADGAWPCEPVRDLAEELRSEDLDRGIAIGKRNARGVVLRRPGGAQEEELAREYERHAASSADRWPRVAALLRAMAQEYRGEARWHDMRDELEER
jgi:hypothetical protein